MTAVLISLLLLAPCVLSDATNCSYYWSLFNGTISTDAVPGGEMITNDVFYIGLVQLKLINEIFAGMIIPKTGTARITSLGITREVKNDAFTIVQILRSTNHGGFQWIKTKSEDLRLVPKKTLVAGGKVLGQDLYIGRVETDEEIVLGKVFPHGFIYQGLYVPSKKTFGHFMSYQVLVFDCSEQ